MRRTLSEKREGRKISPSYGGGRPRVGERMCGAVWISGGSSVCADRCGGDEREAQRVGEKEGEAEGEIECGGEGKDLPPPPLFISGRRRSCARDLLRTISVTHGELRPTI